MKKKGKKERNYIDFYKNEILLRKSYTFPPFCDMLLLNLTAFSENELLKACVFLNSTIKDMAEKEDKNSLVRYLY